MYYSNFVRVSDGVTHFAGIVLKIDQLLMVFPGIVYLIFGSYYYIVEHKQNKAINIQPFQYTDYAEPPVSYKLAEENAVHNLPLHLYESEALTVAVYVTLYL